jgi:vacuolar-type H+-ATPase subunit H
MPVTGGLMLDKKKLLELVDQLRLAVPEQVRAAEEILTKQEQIVNQAVTESRRIKSRAEDEFRERLDQNQLVKSAEQRAESLINDAEQRAAKLLQQAESEASSRRTEADAYALRSLRAMERELNALSASVRKGIDLLAGNAALSLSSNHEPVAAGNGNGRH